MIEFLFLSLVHTKPPAIRQVLFSFPIPGLVPAVFALVSFDYLYLPVCLYYGLGMGKQFALGLRFFHKPKKNY